MPHNSTRRSTTTTRRKAKAAAGDGQGAFKQQGGKRKSAPAPARQTSPLATVLTPDTLGRSLSFLDVSSLVRSEMTAKFFQCSAVGVWTKLDKKIGAGEKADGDSPRDRVIRSSPKYRHHLLAEYAAKVEMMKPTNTETIQRGLRSTLSNHLDFYIRFAKVDAEDGHAKYVGSKRKGQAAFIAGGVFKPSRALDDECGQESIGFDLSQCDLSGWPSMHEVLHPRGQTFSYRMRYDSFWLCEDLIKALHGVNITVVALHRKSLALSIVLASDSHEFIDGADMHGCLWHTQGTMETEEWGVKIPTKTMFFGEHVFAEGRWDFSVE